MTSASETSAVEPPSSNMLMLQLRRAERRRLSVSFSLVLPYLSFIVVTFVLPIAFLLFRAVESPEVSEVLPETSQLLEAWDGEGLPPKGLIQTFAKEVVDAREQGTIMIVAKRLNFEIPGFRGLLLKTARDMPSSDSLNLADQLANIDPRWAEPRYWVAIKHAAPRYTLDYLLAAFDLRRDIRGEIDRALPERRIYLTLIGRTLWISTAVTAICLLLGYPVAYLIASATPQTANLLLLLLLLPFWTSLLVRTTAWLVLLQYHGLVNDFGMWLGLWHERLQLVRNRIGVYVAMTHILLPFMVLPIFSVMKGISPSYMKAAASLGAGPLRAFAKIYFPQTMPGVGAGALLVFILSLGYYITPALVGGPSDQMLSYFIAFNANEALNWGMAAALSFVLLLCVGVFFGIYSRFLSIDKLRTS